MRKVLALLLIILLAFASAAGFLFLHHFSRILKSTTPDTTF